MQLTNTRRYQASVKRRRVPVPYSSFPSFASTFRLSSDLLTTSAYTQADSTLSQPPTRCERKASEAQQLDQVLQGLFLSAKHRLRPSTDTAQATTHLVQAHYGSTACRLHPGARRSHLGESSRAAGETAKGYTTSGRSRLSIVAMDRTGVYAGESGVGDEGTAGRFHRAI